MFLLELSYRNSFVELLTNAVGIAELRWRAALVALEETVEVTHVVEAGSETDVGDAVCALNETACGKA